MSSHVSFCATYQHYFRRRWRGACSVVSATNTWRIENSFCVKIMRHFTVSKQRGAWVTRGAGFCCGWYLGVQRVVRICANVVGRCGF